MAVPWADELRLALCPDELVYVRTARGLRPRPVAKGVIRVAPPGDAEPAWKPVVRALRDAMPRLSARPGHGSVVLSNHFVHFAVVPWHEGAVTPRQRAAHVRRCFRDAYGAAADAWHVREGTASPGKTSLACAVDRDLLDALADAFASRPVRLVSVQPLLVAAFNEFRNRLGDVGCFLLHEPGGLCGGMYAGGEWRSVHSVPLARERSIGTAVRHELDARRVPRGTLIYVCVARGEAPPGDIDKPINLLEAPHRAGSEYGVALLGAGR